MISDLLAFVDARLDEKEASAKAADDPARVLREVAAKRKLIAFALENAARIDGEWGDCHEAAEIARGQCGDYGEDEAIEVLGPLAAIDSDHPDYRQEWADWEPSSA